jgi:hypothetical protein
MHEMVTVNTRYGVAVWCRFCKVTPSELDSMSSEEKTEQSNYCEAQQQKMEA